MKKSGFILITVCVFLSTACGLLQPPAEPDRVTLQLKWLNSAQFAGFYIAQEQGYYAEENIDLTIKPGGFNEDGVINSIDEVISDRAQFGIWSGDSLLTAYYQGQHIKAISAIFQINPTVYISLAENGIKTPADLAGKRIAFGEGNLFLPTVLGSADLTLDDVEIHPLTFDMSPLLTGEVDVWSGYLTDGVIKLQAEGHQLNMILAYDYGAFIYSDTLLTTASLVQENPDLVRRFVQASMRGWKHALSHPDEAVASILRFDPTLDKAQIEAEMQATIPLVDAGQTYLGQMDEVVWSTTQDILLEHDLISAPVDLTALYTNEFVEQGQ